MTEKKQKIINRKLKLQILILIMKKDKLKKHKKVKIIDQKEES